MLPMPANTIEGLIKLLKAQGCQFVLTAATHAAEWFDVASQVPGGQLLQVPELSHFLEQIDQPRYISKRSYAEGRKKPFNVIQSSGKYHNGASLPTSSITEGAWLTAYNRYNRRPETNQCPLPIP